MNKRNVASIKKEDYKWELQVNFLIGLTAEGLNNEETIGNSNRSRTIEVALNDLRNAISGSSLNHTYSANVHSLVDKNELCETCRILSPMKNGQIRQRDEGLSESGNRTKNCPICDLSGFMNVDGKNEKREKPASFSWAIGTKESTRNSVLRNRVDVTQNAGLKNPEKKGKAKKDDTVEKIAKSDMMIFHEELRSGVYAVAVRLDLARIAFDDETQCYVTNDIEFVKKRVFVAIKALMNTIMDISGAKMSVNMPHLTSLEGIVTERTDGSQLMTKYSAMNEDFIDVHKEVANHSVEFKDVLSFKEGMESFLEDDYLTFMVTRNRDYINGLFGAAE